MAKRKATPTTDNTWQNRIVGEGDEAPDQLLANPLNFRTHPGSQADALVGALDTVGWITRVIVNRTTGHVIDGHLRVAQALRRGEATIPVTYVELSHDEERLALATLDPISAMAGQDDEMLRQVLDGLKVDSEDLSAYLAGLHPDAPAGGRKATEQDPDAAPPISRDLRSRTGELWSLGEHRLMIGDALEPGIVGYAMDGHTAMAVWTDPPYNVDYTGSDGQQIANDKMTPADFRAFLHGLFAAAIDHAAPGAPIYIAHADSESYNFRGAMLDAGWLLKQCVVWIKNSFTMGRQDYQWQHEPILYGWKPGAAHYWHGDRNKATVLDDREALEALDKTQLIDLVDRLNAALNPTVIDCPKPSRNDIHPTMKPVALIHRTLGNSLLPGEHVLDVCGGSGSTLMAAETMGAIAHLVEIDPAYADATIKRWQDFTGKEAFRMSDGHDWNSLPTRKAPQNATKPGK
jgi:DNA modification methylase